MSVPKPSSTPNLDRFSRRLGELRSALQNRDPIRLAEATGSEWKPEEQPGEFRLLYWGQPARLTAGDWLVYKGSSTEPASDFEQAMLLYYFDIADGTAEEGRWISFTDLPDGKFYSQAFQGYTGREIWTAYGQNLAAFENACGALGGVRQGLGDASYRFRALPRVPVLVVYWLGDDDFPGSARVLFDASASHYLTTDACAVLGSAITRKIISANLKNKDA